MGTENRTGEDVSDRFISWTYTLLIPLPSLSYPAHRQTSSLSPFSLALAWQFLLQAILSQQNSGRFSGCLPAVKFHCFSKGTAAFGSGEPVCQLTASPRIILILLSMYFFCKMAPPPYGQWWLEFFIVFVVLSSQLCRALLFFKSHPHRHDPLLRQLQLSRSFLMFYPLIQELSLSSGMGTHSLPEHCHRRTCSRPVPCSSCSFIWISWIDFGCYLVFISD